MKREFYRYENMYFHSKTSIGHIRANIKNHQLTKPFVDLLLPYYRQFKCSFGYSLVYRLSTYRHQRLQRQIERETPLHVVFFVTHSSVWKLDGVYKAMHESDHFIPEIVVCPYMDHGNENMMRDMEQTYQFFQNRGYNVTKALKESGEWLDVKHEINPGLIFFTNPHEMTKDEYFIKSFKNCLTCYVPYTQHSGNYNGHQDQHNQLFHNLVWKIFAANEVEKKIANKVAASKGRNIIVTGYPGTEVFYDVNYCPKDPWNPQGNKKKKIIWAPHHTIEDDSPIAYSNFLSIAEQMQDLAIRYADTAQFAFKPHPILLSKLYEHPEWGKVKAESYYNFWNNSSNTQLELGDYADLFLTSDTMIHDSGSFLLEYLYVNKPCLFIVRDNGVKQRMNKLGKLAFDVYRHAFNSSDIEEFIKYVVILGKDEKYEQRQSFIDQYLIKKDRPKPSDAIMQYLTESLGVASQERL